MQTPYNLVESEYELDVVVTRASDENLQPSQARVEDVEGKTRCGNILFIGIVVAYIVFLTRLII
jgi:hypothetical protein